MYNNYYKNSKNSRYSCIENFRYYFREYADKGSIHGLRFLTERRRSPVERLWWFLFLTVSLCVCVFLIVQAYSKWKRSPVIVTFATKETPIRDIPFPAITICPEVKTDVNKCNLSELFELHEAGKLTQKQRKELHYIALICASAQNANIEEIDGGNFEDNEAPEFYMRVRPVFDETVVSCYWSGVDCTLNVSKLFTPTLTNIGVCFSFNMLNHYEIFTSEMQQSHYDIIPEIRRQTSNWTLENGYPPHSSISAIPRRTHTSGVTGGLDLILKRYPEDVDQICGDFMQGYRVFIHNPAQMPSSNKGFFHVGLNQVVLVGVMPHLVNTFRELKSYSPKIRNCYFAKEKFLRFFKSYDQPDCLSECFANFTLSYCGCVPFYMPRDKLSRICGFNSQECLDEARATYLAQVETIENDQQDRKTVHCDCLPSCASLEFDTEVSGSNWNWAESSKKNSFLYGLNKSDKVSRIRIFFKDMQFLSLQRNNLFGQIDFLASCGGLLSLCVGFSFISVVEIIYFATVRLICNIRNYGRRNWSGADE